MIVADTNLIAALVCRTEHTETAIQVWEKDSDWVAPEIWQSELRNVMVMLLRSKFIIMDTALETYRLAHHFVETVPAGTGTILRLCEEYPLTAYDAEFAALSQHLGIPTVSFDPDLTGAGLAVTPKQFLQ